MSEKKSLINAASQEIEPQQKLAEFLERENLKIKMVAISPKTRTAMPIQEFTDWEVTILVLPIVDAEDIEA